MKNLRDDELFRAMSDRLRHYEESVDEAVWKHIAEGARVHENVPSRRAYVTLLLLMLLIGSHSVYQTLLSTDDDETNLASVIQDKSVLSNDQPEYLAEDLRSQESVEHDSIESFRQHNKNTDQTLNILDPGDDVRNKRDQQHDDFDPDDLSKATHPSTENLALVNTKLPSGNATVVQGSTDSLTTATSLMDSALPVDTMLFSKNNSMTPIRIDSSVSRKEWTIIPAARKSRVLAATSLYAMVTSSLIFQHVRPRAQDDVFIVGWDSPPMMSSQRMAYGAEVGLQHAFGNRLSLSVGLSYYKQSITMSYHQQTRDVIVGRTGEFGYEIRPGVETRSFNYNQRSAGANAGLLYRLNASRLSHSLGINLQYEIAWQRIVAEVSYNKAKSIVGGSVFYRLEYPLSQRLNIFVQPAYYSMLTEVHPAHAPFDFRQGRASLSLGMRIMLRH